MTYGHRFTCIKRTERVLILVVAFQGRCRNCSSSSTVSAHHDVLSKHAYCAFLVLLSRLISRIGSAVENSLFKREEPRCLHSLGRPNPNWCTYLTVHLMPDGNELIPFVLEPVTKPASSGKPFLVQPGLVNSRKSHESLMCHAYERRGLRGHNLGQTDTPRESPNQRLVRNMG